MNNMAILEGKRIVLREIIPNSDAEQWFDVMKDPNMHLWTGNTVPSDKAEIKTLLESYKGNADIIAWAIIDKVNNVMIGTYWIWKPMLVDGRLIIASEAQRIASEYWRTGYTREARMLVYRYAFEELKVDEIHAIAWADNTNSCCSMEKVGYILLETKNKMFKKYNKVFKENHYVLRKEAWLKLDK